MTRNAAEPTAFLAASARLRGLAAAVRNAAPPSCRYTISASFGCMRTDPSAVAGWQVIRTFFVDPTGIEPATPRAQGRPCVSGALPLSYGPERANTIRCWTRLSLPPVSLLTDRSISARLAPRLRAAAAPSGGAVKVAQSAGMYVGVGSRGASPRAAPGSAATPAGRGSPTATSAGEGATPW